MEGAAPCADDPRFCYCHEMPPSLREVASPRGDDGRSQSYSWLLLPMIAAAYLPLTPSGASRQLPQRGSHTPRWGQSYFVYRGVYTRDDCEAGAHTGCGNPQLPSKSLVSRPSSPVNPRRGSNGAEPLGREEGPRGTFMEWFPGRVFAFFRRAAKEGRSRRSEISPVQPPVPPQRAILRASADSPFVSASFFPVPSPPAGLVGAHVARSVSAEP